MEKFLNSAILIGIIISFSLISCNDINDISKNNKNIGDPQNFVPQDLELTATLFIYKSKSYNTQLSKVITLTKCDAAFYNAGDYSVNAGTVTVNGDTLRRYSAPTGQQNPDSMYAFGIQPYEDLQFNGGSYSWYVSGTLNYPSLSETISAPDHEININNPSNGANISKLSNLVITWSTSDNPCDTIKILITADGKAINKYVPDTGSYTITANELSIFDANEAISITLAGGNYKFVSLLSKYALISILSSHQIYCTIIQ